MSVALLLEEVAGATAEEGYGPVTVDVPTGQWAAAVSLARTSLGYDFLDFLSAVDEPDGPTLVCHVARSDPFDHLLLRTRLDPQEPRASSVAATYAGAAWHERETAEMFGITFLGPEGEPLALSPLLLPPGLEGHPLRKDFALRSRLERPWPGAKEPGES